MQTTKRIFLMCLLFSVLWILPGCELDSAQRIALYKQAADNAARASEQLDKQLVIIEDVLKEYRQQLSDPNLSSGTVEKIKGYIDEALAKKAELLPAKVKVDTALQQIRLKLAEVQAKGTADLNDEFSVLETTLASAGGAIGGQYGAILIGISTMLPIIGGAAAAIFKAIKNGREAKAANQKAAESQRLTEKVIASVDTLLSSKEVTNREDAIKILKKDQGEAIAAEVKKIKNS